MDSSGIINPNRKSEIGEEQNPAGPWPTKKAAAPYHDKESPGGQQPPRTWSMVPMSSGDTRPI
jgi:hypothetical protein